MKKEDAIIVALVILVLIVGAIAFYVTGNGLHVNNEKPVQGKAPQLNNTNVSNTTDSSVDSANRDTGITASSSASSGSSQGYSSSYYGGGSSSTGYNTDSGSSTPSGDTGGSDTGTDSDTGQTADSGSSTQE